MITEFLGHDNKQMLGEVILDERSLKRLADKLMKVSEFAYDTETNTLRVLAKGELELVGISFCFGEYDTYYIPTGHIFDKGQLPVEIVAKYLRPVFARTDVRVIGANLKFDMHVLADVDVEVKTDDLFDIQVARWLTDENLPKGLKDMTASHYDIPQTHFDECLKTVTLEEKKSLGLKGSSKAIFPMVRIKIGAPYALADAYWTWRHYVDWTHNVLEEEKMETIFYKGQMPFLKTLYNMERRGANINFNRLHTMNDEVKKDLESLEYRIMELSGVLFKVTSSQQLSEILFGYKKMKNGEFVGNAKIVENSFDFPVVKKTPTGAPKTGNSELLALLKKVYKKDKKKQEGQKMIRLILKYKKLEKLRSSFMQGLIDRAYPDGKVHPTFKINGTDSGRLSCIAQGTPITLVNGYKNIEDVKVGDLVYCYDKEGKLRVSKVNRFMDNGIRPCVKITWRSQGKHELGELVCTPDHKIRMRDGEWIEAQDLVKGDKLTHLKLQVDVLDLVVVGDHHVYDLEIDKHHNFIASEICVHNCADPNLQQLPRPVELDEYIRPEEWEKEHEVTGIKEFWDKNQEYLELYKGYPTGNTTKVLRVSANVAEYLEYLKEWHNKNKDTIMFKYYEIRDCIIPDNPEEECLIALD